MFRRPAGLASLLFIAACIMAALVPSPAPASSGSVTFQLYQVTFSNGSVATGTFDYDFQSGTATKVNLVAAGFPFQGSDSTEISATQISGSYESETSTASLQLGFTAPLDPVNGAVVAPAATSSFLNVNSVILTVTSGLVLPVSSLPATAATLSGASGSNNWFTSAVDVAITATAGARPLAGSYFTLDGGTPQRYTGSLQVSTEGQHVLAYWSVDSAGFVETSHSVAIDIDESNPLTSAYRSGETVYLQATDAVSGVASILYSVNGGQQQVYSHPIIAPVGSDTIVYFAVDVAGNQEAPNTLPFTTGDTIPPTPPGSPHWVMQTTAGGTIAWTASTDNVAVAKYEVMQLRGHSGRDGGYTWYVIGSTTQTQYNVSVGWGLGVRAIDAAGNRSAIATVGTVAAPTTSLSLSGISGSNGWYTGTVTATLTANAGAASLAGTYYSLDGASNQPYTGPIAVSPDGFHSLMFWSVNGAGLTETPQTANINIDSHPPVTVAGHSGNTVTLSASDATSGPAVTYYTVNDGEQLTYVGPFEAPAGSDRVDFYSVDYAGNQEAPQTLAFRTDDTIPPTAPGNPHWIVKGATGGRIAWTASTDNVGVAGYLVYQLRALHGGSTWHLIGKTTKTEFHVSTTKNLGVQAFDAAGNKSDIANVN